MSDKGGFLEIRRNEPGYRFKRERIKDYKAVELIFDEEQTKNQAERCMDCGTPFCHCTGCPLHNIPPEFNKLVRNGRWKAALDNLLSTNPFPEFTGRICPAPCEGSCVLGINDDPVTIRQIEIKIVEKGFKEGYIKPRPPAVRLDKNVAVMGSGPAGLAAAEILNKAGYKVVVYENNEKPGGVLMYGIPDFKLEKRVVNRRIELMKDEGVVFETGVEVGRDLSYRFLNNRHDAIVLTGGAREPRNLNVPGRDLKGIHFAMDFLVQQNKRLADESIENEEEITAKDKAVVVLGGGDTGSDCLGTSIRQGARLIHQFEIMPKPPAIRSPDTPWPEWPHMLHTSSSHQEGGQRRWCISTTEFVGNKGHVEKLKCVEVEWVRPNEGGSPIPRQVEGTEFTVETKLVLLALGFTGPGNCLLVDELKLEADNRGFIKSDENMMTSKPGVFVAGDMTRGPSLVVHAIANGMKTARGVIDYLTRT
ncbi:MAG: glutamate synthase subunit beta [Proteobacteria bacterium]|nr:glutamate synthase subunit beta [Pseudomonadota bacterium]